MSMKHAARGIFALLCIASAAGALGLSVPAGTKPGNVAVPGDSPGTGSGLQLAQISGSQLVIERPGFELRMNGPYITSFRADGANASTPGAEWIHGPSGYQWFEEGQHDAPLAITSTGTWSNASDTYTLAYTVGDAFDATLTLTVAGNTLQFGHSFTALRSISARMDGWVWSLAQTTPGYDTPLLDAVWGHFNGEPFQFITAHQFKRRAYVNLFGWMNDYHLQGKAAAKASLGFSLAGSNFVLTALDIDDHLGLVSWGYWRSEGKEDRDCTAGAVVSRAYTVKVVPRASTHDDAPEQYPRFEITTGTRVGPSGDLDPGESLTRFYWDRAYSWEPQGGGDWIDWGSIMFAWQDVDEFALRQRRNVENIVIDPTGYVYTWGAAPGWPFPDNSKHDTRHSTTNPNYLTALYRLWTWEANNTWLDAQQARVRNATAWLLRQIVGPGDTSRPGLFPAAEGLYLCDFEGHHGADGGIGTNYWDILPFGWLSAFENALAHEALVDVARMEACWGNASGEAALLAAAAKLKAAYNEAFWDDMKGRYVGCVDEFGGVHDYGFTFVNTQAITCGLANASQVHRIYAWMELEPTSSGTNDAFTRWGTAPIANTDVNHHAAPNRTIDEDWWVKEGVVGTGMPLNEPWGPQLQDGGMSMYTSWYDLMARARYLSGDDAARRLEGILDRWGYPDRTCGGAPLYLGEIPQQENQGSVGTDFPFPESGMVATALVYGILNATPRWTGAGAAFSLDLAPLLPDGWDAYTIRNVRFGFAALNVTVNQTAVTVDVPAGVTNTQLNVTVNGTTIRLADHSPGTVVLERDARAGEKAARYQVAADEHAARVASGQVINALGVPALAALPDVASPTLLDDLAAWWGDAINLMDAATFSSLQSAISEVSARTPGIEPVFPRARVEYPFVMLERQHAAASRQRGDLRWCLVHYQRALVIQERVDTMENEGRVVTFASVPGFAMLALGAFVACKRRRSR
ncbi:MAG: hypothetical protein JW839_15700 [Candidatus Lokiarchaeota archaeon]|nr:hypothetical protein [Candidatus Lokiarchaeota archaeon]